MSHPCPFTPSIIDVLRPILDNLGLPVHDPYAGTGERLGRLCDELGLIFTGAELEAPFIVDQRVRWGDSTHESSYPPVAFPGHPGVFVICTSPVYPSGMADHFKANDASTRHTYRQGLAKILGYDRPLHPNNMGRWGNRYRRSFRSEQEHWRIAKECIEHWPHKVILNVKDIVASAYVVHVADEWRALMGAKGYVEVKTVEVATPGQRQGANGSLRAEGEVVMVFEKEST